MTQAMTYQERVGTLRQALEKSSVQLKAALPKHITAERMLRIVMTSAQRNPKLLECTPMSVLGAVFTSAQLGLVPDDVSGEAYLIPFKNNRKGVSEAQFMPGYKGLMKLAWNAGFVKVPTAEVVYEKDEFSVTKGSDPRIVHVPYRGKDRGEVVAYYALIKLVTGGEVFSVMEAWEMAEHRDRYSRSKDSGPWKTDPIPMGKKTVLKQSLKLVPSSSDRDALAKSLALDDRLDAGIPQEIDLDIVVPEIAEAEAGEEKPALERLADEFEEPKTRHTDHKAPRRPPLEPGAPILAEDAQPDPEPLEGAEEPPADAEVHPDVYVHDGKPYKAGDTLPDGRLIESVDDGIPTVSKAPRKVADEDEDWELVEKRARACAGKGTNPPFDKMWMALTETYDEAGGYDAMLDRLKGFETGEAGGYDAMLDRLKGFETGVKKRKAAK